MIKKHKLVGLLHEAAGVNLGNVFGAGTAGVKVAEFEGGGDVGKVRQAALKFQKLMKNAGGGLAVQDCIRITLVLVFEPAAEVAVAEKFGR